MLDGEVLQQPTTPVVKETNMKKKATMNRAIIARAISERNQSHQIIIIPAKYVQGMQNLIPKSLQK